MRLLFDNNLSFRLVGRLSDVYPAACHVRDFGLADAPDATVWECAKEHGLAIVSKDDDFRQLSFLRGAPPKVIWVKLGNCNSTRVEAALRDSVKTIENFLSSNDGSFLMLTATHD